jgi:hypothetical protein
MKSIKTSFGLMFIVVLVSSACGVPLLPAAPPATSTPDAMMTALVETLTAIYAPTDIPTSTPTPLPPTEPPTETLIPFPTITPIPSFTPQPSFTPFGTPPSNSLTLTPGSGEGAGTSEYKCKIVEKSPDNWTVYKSRQAFDAVWKLRNAGAKKWIQGNVVLVYVDGAKFHQGDQKILPIPHDVDPGDESAIGADFIAPKAKGNYMATWGLMDNRSKTVFCTLTVMITVK